MGKFLHFPQFTSRPVCGCSLLRFTDPRHATYKKAKDVIVGAYHIPLGVADGNVFSGISSVILTSREIPLAVAADRQWPHVILSI